MEHLQGLPNHDELHLWTMSQSKRELLWPGIFSLQWETQLTSISILMIRNLSLMNPKTVRIPVTIHYAAGIQRKLNLGRKPSQITDFPRTVKGVLYIDNLKPRRCDSLFGPQWEKAFMSSLTWVTSLQAADLQGQIKMEEELGTGRRWVSYTIKCIWLACTWGSVISASFCGWRRGFWLWLSC